MISGIYLLKFIYKGQEYQYVGKSVDIMRRFQEHVDSFIKGKAAKKLQTFYNLCGEPEFYIVQRCHPDHIDVLEAYYIDFFKGEYSLNTVKMSNPFTHVNPSEHSEYLNRSLDSLIFDITNLEGKNVRSSEIIEALNREVDSLERIRSDEELKEDISNRIAELEASRSNVLLDLFNLQDKINAYNKLPWYKRLFHKPL